MLGALFFHRFTSQNDSPVVVLALSIASITYGALLGTYVLASVNARAKARDVITALVFTVVVMLVVVFAKPIAATFALDWLAPVGRLAWPWYVPLGTVLTVGVGYLMSRLPEPARPA